MLTYQSITKLKSGTKSDGSGLYIRVLPSGAKNFIVKKRINGKTFTKSLGFYPQLSLIEARALAKKYIEAQQENISNTKTFEAVFNEWIQNKALQVKKNIKLRFNILLPELKNEPFDLITTLQVANLIKKYTKNGTQKLESAKRLAIWLKQLEVFAVNSGYVDHYKFQGIGKIIPPPTATPRPSVIPQDLPEIIQKFKLEQRQSPAMWDIFLMALYTLLRPGEYTQMQFSWIDNNIIVIPAQTMKMKREHKVPITDQIQALLQRRRSLTDSDYVFESSQKPNRPIQIFAMEKFMRKHGFSSILVPHGIRAIGRTWMRENKIEHDVAEMCLAHLVGSDTERAYNRSELLEERRNVMQRWCNYVDECICAEKIKGKGKYFYFE